MTFDHFVLVRSKHVEKFLAKLDVDSGTGPDAIAARVLEICSKELCVPLAKLIRRMLAFAFWPTAWTVHWSMLLYKKQSPSNPVNYRAINLTTQVSKVVERFLGQHFAPQLETRAFGSAQFAYRKKHGARDALLMYALSWVASLHEGDTIGLYCSDVSGAFDKVKMPQFCWANCRLLI